MLENADQALRGSLSVVCSFATQGLIRLVASARSAVRPGDDFQRGLAVRRVRPMQSTPLVRMVDLKAVVHIADMRTDQSYVERNPRVVAFVDTRWRADSSRVSRC